MPESVTKQCSHCKQRKPAAEFGRNRSRPDGLNETCRECIRDHYHANIEVYRERSRQQSKTHRGRARERLRRWREAHPETREAGREYSRQWYAENREQALRRKAEAQAAQRVRVLAHYGTACACCGTTERLSIDHVNGDGGAHRRELGGASYVMYRWLIAQGFPAGFQTLCVSCNQSKGKGKRCRLDHP